MFRLARQIASTESLSGLDGNAAAVEIQSNVVPVTDTRVHGTVVRVLKNSWVG